LDLRLLTLPVTVDSGLGLVRVLLRRHSPLLITGGRGRGICRGRLTSLIPLLRPVLLDRASGPAIEQRTVELLCDGLLRLAATPDSQTAGAEN